MPNGFRSLVPFLCLLGAVAPVVASSGGINGFSGLGPNTCSVCHNTGTPPVVTLDGPTSVAPGTVSTYTLTIAVPENTVTDQKAGGLGVGVNGGVLVVSDPGTRIAFGDLTHNAPRDMDVARNVTFTFDWEAPVSTGDFTLYAAGNAVNLNGGTSGDAASATTLAVSVGAVASTPGEASGDTLSPLLVADYDPASGDVSILYEVGCGTTDSAIYFGQLADVSNYGYAGETCDVGTSGAFGGFRPGDGSYFFLIVGNDGVNDGSYGKARNGATRLERPPFDGNSCGLIQSIADRCD